MKASYFKKNSKKNLSEACNESYILRKLEESKIKCVQQDSNVGNNTQMYAATLKCVQQHSNAV